MQIRNVTKERPMKNTSINFDPDILDRINAVKGYMSRSCFVNTIMDRALPEEEAKMKQSN